MFCLFYRIYGHFVFRSPQPPPLGANDGRGAPGRLSAPGGMRPGQVGSTEAYDRPCERFWVPFATKRYKASAAYAAVKAALPTKKRQTTPVEECKYLLQPGDTQKIPALKTQGFSRRTAKPGAMRPDYRIPYLRRIFRIRGSRSEIMRS